MSEWNSTNDDVLGMYHAQFRFFDAESKGFTQVDPVKDRLNWYGYCNSNPVMYIDPSGLAPVNIVDYCKAMGANVDEYTKNGRLYAKITNCDTTREYSLSYGIMDDELLNSIFGFKSFLTDEERETGVGIGIKDGKLYRDIITPGKDYYHLDYNGNIIRVNMEDGAIHVNVVTGDAGKLSRNPDSCYALAEWLKDFYYEQFEKEFEVNTKAMAIEITAHELASRYSFDVPFVGNTIYEHARNADIGEVGHENFWERWIWDDLASGHIIRDLITFKIITT